VHGKRADARVLGNARNRERVAIVGIDAGADLERDRHVDGAHDRVDDRVDERLVRSSAEPAAALQTFFAGQPMLMSMICAPRSTL
jgi:hypothetical protein